MTDPIRFMVPGAPQPKERARTTRKGSYTPKKTREYEALVGWHGRIAMGDRALLTGPLSITVTIHRQLQQRATREQREQAARGLLWCDKRPDADNYVKGALDALNGVLWRDDGQIAELVARKIYSEEPGLEIEARELEPSP